MNKNDFIIIAPTYYSSPTTFRYFSRSARIHSIDVSNYGYGKPYVDWMQTHITDCITKLEEVRMSFPYVLFTDAVDVIFLQGADEIARRYTRLGCPPILVSMEPDGLNAGGWIGEIDVAIEILKYLSGNIGVDSGNPQTRWRWAVSQWKIRLEYDAGDVIFSVNQFPTDACIFHRAGGCSDKETGKAYALDSIWKELGYEW